MECDPEKEKISIWKQLQPAGPEEMDKVLRTVSSVSALDPCPASLAKATPRGIMWLGSNGDESSFERNGPHYPGLDSLSALLKDNNLNKFLVTWKPLLDFFQDQEKNQLLTLGCED